MPKTVSAAERKALVEALWPSDAWSFMKTWAILDGARDERIVRAVDRSYQDKCCLFAGNLSPQLKAVAPYLVRIDRGEELSDYVLENGWGNAWGVFFSSSGSLETLRKHFRKFLRATDEAGRRLLFRFYDPRVLSIYLPTCNHEELTTIFEPIDRFVLETEAGAHPVEYRFSGLRLKPTLLAFGSDGAHPTSAAS
jgi:hypothetical protein